MKPFTFIIGFLLLGNINLLKAQTYLEGILTTSDNQKIEGNINIIDNHFIKLKEGNRLLLDIGYLMLDS